MRAEATHELLASREDVWAFLAEPRHLADWWPGIAAVEPDRLGFSPGARWQVRRTAQPTLFRRGHEEELLLVRRVERPDLAAWHLTRSRLDAELRLEPAGPQRTRASLSVAGPFFPGFRRSLPKEALSRLHALCQTSAGL